MNLFKNIIKKIYYYSGRWIGARYIYHELFMPFIFSISVVTFVLLMDYLIKEIDRLLGKGLSFFTIVEFIYLNMAWIIAMAVPMAVLVASIMAYGRLSEDNEIVAMRSSGISFLSILAPGFVFGVIIAVLMVLFQNNVLPNYNYRAKLLSRDIYQKKPGLTIEPGYFIDDMEGYSLYVKDKNEKTGLLLDLTIYNKNIDKEQTTIYADSGRINVVEGNIIFTLFSGEIHKLDVEKYEKYQRIYFTKHKISIPADDMYLERSEKGRRNEREMDIAMMYEEVKKFRKSRDNVAKKIEKIVDEQLGIDNYKNYKSLKMIVEARKDSNEVTFSPAKAKMENRKLTGVLNRVKNEEGLKKNYKKKINKYLVEIHKKISMPFACIIFVMIGTPIGVMSKQGGIALGAVTSIFFFLIYYVFLIGGEELSDMAIISPFWAMWSSNILLGGVGIYLIYRATYELKSLNLFGTLNIFKKLRIRGKNAGS